VSAGVMADQLRRLANERAGHTLCKHCNGTGNELYSMYRACPECGGNGIAERFGRHPALIRRLALCREWNLRRRALRMTSWPGWKDEARLRLSYWLGISHWFTDNRDRCCRCDALPSDVDFEMLRIGPRRAEWHGHQKLRDGR
jgi:hypothetical protein